MGVVAALGTIMVLATILSEGLIEAIASLFHIVIKEEWKCHIGGGIGTIVAGIMSVIWVKKKNLVDSEDKTQSFSIKRCLIIGVLAWSVCDVLYDFISTPLLAYVFHLSDSLNVVEEKSIMDVLIGDLIFPILVAPIFEELIFRYGFYNLLKQRFGKISITVISSILFALLHSYAIQGFGSCLIAGLFLMYIYIRTGDIKYSIVSHMIFNIDSNVLNMLEDKGVTLWGIPLQYEIEGFNMVHPVFIIIAISICLVYIINKRKEIMNFLRNAIKM